MSVNLEIKVSGTDAATTELNNMARSGYDLDVTTKNLISTVKQFEKEIHTS